ncbi:MAG: hypothetical protein J0H51_18615 [Rhizobiales bacterium]|nr:hypothetical protein [Hyphomicrobiales bacterium]
MVRPAFRAPSSQEGEAFLAKLGRITPRDREGVSDNYRCLTGEAVFPKAIPFKAIMLRPLLRSSMSG